MNAPKLSPVAQAAQKAVANMTRGERVIAFIEEFCTVPEGTLVGQPMKLDGFQRAWILEVYDNPHGTKLAILSIARKNGKSPLIAAILLCHIVGPEARQNSQIVAGAMSKKQAGTVFKYMQKMIRADDRLAALCRVKPSVKEIIGTVMNVEFSAIARKATTAQGLAPVVAVLDEAGQIRGDQDDFVDAITTSMGAYDDSMLIVISTQAASDSDLLSVWIDDYREHKDPQTVCHVHEAPVDCDVLDESAWRAANPALGNFRSLSDMQKLAREASRMPSKDASFRNLNLNQRVETLSPLISRGVWIANSFAPDPLAFSIGQVFGGLDLSARMDLTALVLISFYLDRWHVKPFFWTPSEGLHERAKRDRQNYPLWKEQGFLRTTPGASVDYDHVVSDMRDILAGMNVKQIAFDRWRISLFEQSMQRCGVYDWPMMKHGQGFGDMGLAVDELEAALVNDRVSHGNHPVLTMCAANAVVVKDEAGNRKLDRKRATGRIDGMQAMAMAFGAASRTISPDGNLEDFLRNVAR